MKKWLCILLVCVLLCGMTACKNTPDKPESNGTPTTTTTNQSLSLSEYFTSVLEDKQAFVYDGEEVTLSHLLADFEADINRYTLVDMDGDKQTEMVVVFDSEQFILVLHKDGEACYGYLFGFRSMYRINTDGSCYWTSSAFEYGCARLQFHGDSYEWIELWSANLKDSDDDTDLYYVNGKPASKEEYDAVASVKKTKVEWIVWDAATTTSTSTTTTTTSNKTTTTDNKTTTNGTSGKKTTTTERTTLSTNPYTAADLFFPLDSSAVNPPKSATMAAESIAFDDVQRRVRLQLPERLTVRTAQQNGHTYAVLYYESKRVGRLLVNYIYPDIEAGTNTGDTVTIGGVDVHTMWYSAGAEEATTYYGFFIDTDNFFYTLEISTDYISQQDFAACLSSLQIIELLERNNRLDCRNQDGLRVAIAGNSFIAYSCVASQLQRMVNENHKNATVDGFSYPNITVAQIAADPQIMQTLCGGNYDILFLSSAYHSEDVTALSAVEAACQKSGTELVLFPAHNEGTFNTGLAYKNTNVKLAHWKVAVDNLIEAGIPESDLIWYDGPRHSKELAGYCGAVMIYGMLYESAPNTAAIGAGFSGLSVETAQLVEDLTMEFVRPYFE